VVQCAPHLKKGPVALPHFVSCRGTLPADWWRPSTASRKAMMLATRSKLREAQSPWDAICG
jgi:hypothetical protein